MNKVFQYYKKFYICKLGYCDDYYVIDINPNLVEREEKYLFKNMELLEYDVAYKKLEKIQSSIDHLTNYDTIQEAKDVIDKLFGEKPEYFV